MLQNKKIYYWLLSIVFGLSLLVYIRNAWVYAQGAAYDGGAHIDYIMTIVEQKRLPLPNENYIAWHEPLYYVVHAGIISLVPGLLSNPTIIQKFLQVENAIVAWSMVIAAVLLVPRLTKKQSVVLLVAIGTPAIFVLSALGRYATNETWFQAGVIWFVCWFIYKKMTDPNVWSVRLWFFAGIFLGLLTLVKLTAFVLVAALFLWIFLLAREKRNWRLLYPIVILGVCVVLGYAPWLVYKHHAFGLALTINNFENKQGVVETRTLPTGFFYTFDWSIFKRPTWPTGQTSFSTMVFASAFGDYDNVFERYERKPADAVQTVNGRFMPRFTWRATRIVFVLWLPLLGFIVWGALLKVYKKATTAPEFFMSVIIVAFSAALVYNVVAYPFLERGTLKAIFVAAIFPLLFVLGLSGIKEFLVSKKYVISSLLFSWYIVLCALVSWVGVVWSR